MEQGNIIASEFVVKSQGAENTLISGYASVFGVSDLCNDVIMKGAFKDVSNAKVKLLWQHDYLKPIGVITALYEDDYGLKMNAEINNKTIAGSEAAELIKQKAIEGLSIGFKINSFDYNDHGQRVIDDIELAEISVVTFPANKEAVILEFKGNQSKENRMQNYFERPNMEILETAEYKNAFNNFIRKGIESDLITKAFSSGAEEGGVAITPTLHSQIISAINAKSPMRQVASVETISTNALEVIIEDGVFASGWVAETESRKDTDTPKLQKIAIPVHELYAQPKATQKLIDDSAINIENWLIERLSDSFVRLENEAFIKGDGKNKPLGLLVNQKVKVLNLGKVITPDSILALINSLDEGYLANASFLMNRMTISAIQSLKDTTGRFIWQQSMSEHLEQTIFGIPVIACSNMPNTDEGPAIAIGDFKSAYKIVDRGNINIMRDPYTDKPFIKFYAVKRVGGDVVNPDAVRFAKIA